jgi:DNA-binding MarR family transcriptional regulator
LIEVIKNLSYLIFYKKLHIKYFLNFRYSLRCESVSTGKSNITRIIRILESKEFITKKVGNKDGRLVYFLSITKKGEQIIDLVMPKIKKCITDMFESVSDEEIELLHSLSKKFDKDLHNVN